MVLFEIDSNYGLPHHNTKLINKFNHVYIFFKDGVDICPVPSKSNNSILFIFLKYIFL